MNPDPVPFQTIGNRDRAMAALAALTASIGIAGTLVLSFASTAPELWPRPSAALMAEVAQCDLQNSRAAQTQCKQQVIAAWRAPEKQGRQLARR